MIDIPAFNARLVAQDAELRSRLNAIADTVSPDDRTAALAQLLVEGLAAIHERQGNLITLMLQTNT